MAMEWQRLATSDRELMTSGTTNGNEWQRVVQRVTTSNNEWYSKWQLMTTSDNDWQQVTKNDNDWQRMKASDKTDEYEWKQIK